MNADNLLLRCPVWRPPAGLPPLERHQVQLWRVDIATVGADLAEFEATLDADERARAARFLVAGANRQFVVARSILRRLLAPHVGIPAAEIRFALGTYGKPYLAADTSGGLRFNVSHSGDMILLALSREREVGADVERIHALQSRAEIAERFFSLPEAQRIRGLPAEERERSFFHHWVRKEAFVKAVGKGIASGLSMEVEVLVRAAEPPPAACEIVEPHTQSPWRLFSFDIGRQYLGALAAAGDDWVPDFLLWRP